MGSSVGRGRKDEEKVAQGIDLSNKIVQSLFVLFVARKFRLAQQRVAGDMARRPESSLVCFSD
jgi:hypothetical protein